MFRAIVAQKPTLMLSRRNQKYAPPPSGLSGVSEKLSILSKPTRRLRYTKRNSVNASRNGADQSNIALIAREPFHGGAMIATQTWMIRNSANIAIWNGPGRTNQSTFTGGSLKPGDSSPTRTYIA